MFSPTCLILSYSNQFTCAVLIRCTTQALSYPFKWKEHKKSDINNFHSQAVSESYFCGEPDGRDNLHPAAACRSNKATPRSSAQDWKRLNHWKAYISCSLDGSLCLLCSALNCMLGGAFLFFIFTSVGFWWVIVFNCIKKKIIYGYNWKSKHLPDKFALLWSGYESRKQVCK